jgi:hypothetical protein
MQSNGFKENVSLIILIALCLLIALARVHTYNEPLERDLTTYAVIAHEMLAGKDLYSELWDHKPPGIHFTYAVMEFITGYGPISIYWLNIMAAIITLFGVYFAGTAITGGRRNGGLWAATCWAIISGNLSYQANQPNVEVFMNACLIWAFVLFIKDDWGSGYRKALCIGLLLALATFYKQIAIVVLLLLGCTYIAIPPAALKRWQALIHVMVMGGIVAVAWALMFSYFAIMGRFEAFYDAVFVYNQAYAGNLFNNLQMGLRLQQLFPLFTLPVVLPLGILTLIGMMIGLLTRKRLWIWLLMYAGAVQIMVALPGKFYPHYYQLWLPLLAVGAGLAIIELREVVKFQWISQVVAIVVVVILLYYQLPLYKLSPLEWSYKKYGNQFIVTWDAAQEIAHLFKDDETFFEWGAETGLYFYTQRRPPSGVFFHYPLVGGPLAQKLSQRVITDLERHKPELLIIPARLRLPKEHPVIAWLLSHSWQTAHTQNNNKYFSFFIRRGGNLEARLNKRR